MKSLLYLSIVLSLNYFLPNIFFWQIPLAVFSFGMVLIIFVYQLLIFKRRQLLQQILALVTILVVYFCNWTHTTTSKFNDGGISLAIDSLVSDLKIDSSSNQLKINDSSLFFQQKPIETLGQKFGQVFIAQLKDKHANNFTVAFCKIENLFSLTGWAKNKIFLRRLAVVLKHSNEPVLVVLKSKIPVGAALIRLFMFQARLENKYTHQTIKSLFGLETEIFLTRNIEFDFENDILKFTLR